MQQWLHKFLELPMKIILSIISVIFFAPVFTDSPKPEQQHRNNEFLVQSVLWYQHSGEMRALYYQGYNIAKFRLADYLRQSKSKKKKAVVMDIDETILNNSPYEGRLLEIDSGYSKSSWSQWVATSGADTLPGVLDFLNYAKSKNVEVFYISNRDTAEVPATLKNFQKFNFPYADEKHLVFKREKSSSKETRRKQVAENYDIALLCGDNLADFDAAFDLRDEKFTNDSVNKYKAEFGKKFIVLPNPMYGDWEKPIYGNAKASFERDSLRRANLKSF
jgi:5'-nucleotidase (lipoprotein e(P4) family)